MNECVWESVCADIPVNTFCLYSEHTRRKAKRSTRALTIKLKVRRTTNVHFFVTQLKRHKFVQVFIFLRFFYSARSITDWEALFVCFILLSSWFMLEKLSPRIKKKNSWKHWDRNACRRRYCLTLTVRGKENLFTSFVFLDWLCVNVCVWQYRCWREWK